MSKWGQVTNDMFEGSRLGLGLFNIFVGDMGSGIECILCKFLDGTKLYGGVNKLERRDAIQRDLDRTEMSVCKPHKIQQGQGPAAGSW